MHFFRLPTNHMAGRLGRYEATTSPTKTKVQLVIGVILCKRHFSTNRVHFANDCSPQILLAENRMPNVFTNEHWPFVALADDSSI